MLGSRTVTPRNSVLASLALHGGVVVAFFGVPLLARLPDAGPAPREFVAVLSPREEPPPPEDTPREPEWEVEEREIHEVPEVQFPEDPPVTIEEDPPHHLPSLEALATENLTLRPLTVPEQPPEVRPEPQPVAQPIEAAAPPAPALPEPEAKLVEPVPIKSECREPRYPRIAQRRRWTGDVLLGLTIRSDGTVARVWVIQSSGHGVLDEAAAEAVEDWRFTPPMRGDTPFEGDFDYRIKFREEA